jgi:hypothetical protein
MEIQLLREYFSSGTNGSLLVDGMFVCFTIELPWLSNHRRVSCIPEGRYPIRKRFSYKRDWHLEVLEVPERSLILIHPANDALKELQGCIAPVSLITGHGKGSSSRKAFSVVNTLVFGAIDRKEQVFLTIKRK